MRRDNKGAAAALPSQDQKQTITHVSHPLNFFAMTRHPLKRNKSTELDANGVLFLARFIVLCGADMTRLKFRQTHNKIIDVYPLWQNIFKFLINKDFVLFETDKFLSENALRLANFSATIARPSLGLANETLAQAALNADLPLARTLINGTAKYPNLLNSMLSEKFDISFIMGNITVSRSGTALQMALYSQDVEMVKLIKQHMSPEAFHAQCEATFGRNHGAFLSQQKSEALQLCAKIKVVFHRASSRNIHSELANKVNNYSELHIALRDFKEDLETYVKAHPVHNPYILHCLSETCASFDKPKRQLFCKTVIGLSQKYTSITWLQSLVLGLADRSESREYIPPVSPTTSSHCNELQKLGVSHCISIFGGLSDDLGYIWDYHATEERLSASLEIMRALSNKNNQLSELLPRELRSYVSCAIQ